VKRLWEGYGGHTNSKGYMVLDDSIRVLWGDGIDPNGINDILKLLQANGFAAENMVFGMGGGLLQRCNRDTQRFAFKSSAQKRDGVWFDVQKKPLDATKTSKAGKLLLVKDSGGNFATINENELDVVPVDALETVFLDGELLRDQTFEEVRTNSNG
jgi:nicotinamide phosphoribosyltransferase